MVALIATRIFAHEGQKSRSDGASSTSNEEAIWELCAGLPHLFPAKWFVPGWIKVAGGESSVVVERIKDRIAFLVFILGSFLLNLMPFLHSVICKGPACTLYPPAVY